MKANELRIGNKFILPNGEIGTISYHEIRLMSISLDPINYKPIPLTEEWLLRFCFKKVRYEKYAHEKLDKLKAYPHVIKDGYGFYIQGAYTLPNIKYVHQLQNLYFALTGEELKIQL